MPKPKPKLTYFIEITDTFGGDANYAWVTRHLVRAVSTLGAINVLSRNSGISWRRNYDDWDTSRYDSKSGATCAFVTLYDPEYHDYKFNSGSEFAEVAP
jgi:hypothetical protein